MSARLLGGARLARRIREMVRAEAERRTAARGRPPLLAALAVDPDAGETSYLEMQARVAAETGIRYRTHVLGADATTAQVCAAVERLCADPQVDGLFVSLPLPAHVDTEAVLDSVDPARDADALGRGLLARLMLDPDARMPATARAVLAVLEEAEVPLAGTPVTLVGRGRTAGLPVMLALMNAGATVTVVHRLDPDLPSRVRGAPVVIAAAGKPGLVRARDLRADAVVVDVGTSEDGGILRGDVEPEAQDVCAALTPVPGGVGPVTTAFLMANTLEVMR